MAEGQLTNYQYWGLVGQGAAAVGSSLSQGFGASAAAEVQAGGYGSSAEMLEIQAEQETINAEAAATARMEQFNQGEAANVAVMAAMGKTGENTTISDANYETAIKDVSIMKAQGRSKNLQARSGASAARSARKQAKITSKYAKRQAIGGAILGAGAAVGTGFMLAG